MVYNSLLWGGSKYSTGTPVSNVDISSEVSWIPPIKPLLGLLIW